ncbi:MAG TPA: Uma2 family endonuclease [Candidatus Limivivens intestinipullorum]|uniref:Uma2 family endonuclease n=1 Tax=Candidatus Limivivens intestinipullorum TaxID=2840858 RepID=A0A9D1ERN9_9FIRM|nr:Uma2 family endonuclease [Candidatus Limivivens intestinipullorum]
MALPQENTYTIEDIYKLPEGTRAELIDGQIYYMAPPSRMHQKILHFFDRTIGNYIAEKGGLCEIYPAPFAVFLNKDAINYVEPDLSVICDPSKLDDKGCHGAPDWIIEIVSPSSQCMDYLTKLLRYRTAGVREYWIVNPMTRMVTVYAFHSEEQTGMFSFDDEIPVTIYPGFTIKLTDVL